MTTPAVSTPTPPDRPGEMFDTVQDVAARAVRMSFFEMQGGDASWPEAETVEVSAGDHQVAHDVLRALGLDGSASAAGLQGAITRPPAERFFAIRRTDGEQIHGDYGWMKADHEDDWSSGESDSEYGDGEIEYEIVEMTVRFVARRSFGFVVGRAVGDVPQ